MKFFAIFVFFSIAMVAPALANCDGNEKQITLGLGSDGQKFARRLAADQIKALLDRELQGKACLLVVADKEKFSDEKIFEALKSGAITMGMPRLKSVAERVREYQVFGLPFALIDFQAATRFQTSPAVVSMQKKLSVLNVRSLGIIHGGFDQLVSKKQVLKPQDALGVRFDVTSDGVFSDLVTAVKGLAKRRNNKTVAQSFVDDDFQTAPASWVDLENPKLREALSVVMQSNHAYRGYELVIAQAWIDGLDADLRKNIEQVMQRGVTQVGFEAVRRENASRNGLIRANKPVLALSRSQWDMWRSSVNRIWDRFAQAYGLELMAALQDANRAP